MSLFRYKKKTKKIMNKIKTNFFFDLNISDVEVKENDNCNNKFNTQIHFNLSMPIIALYIHLEGVSKSYKLYIKNYDIKHSDFCKEYIQSKKNSCVIFHHLVNYFMLEVDLEDLNDFQLEMRSSNICSSDFLIKYFIPTNFVFSDKKEKIVVVTHNTTNSGAPLLSLNITKKLSETCDVFLLSLGYGELEEKFREEIKNFYSLQEDPDVNEITNDAFLRNIIACLYDIGFKKVLLNSVVSGIAIDYFKNSDFKIISLIHEKKSIVVELNKTKIIENVFLKSDYILFPSLKMKFEYKNLIPNDKAVLIKAQGYFVNPKTVVDEPASIIKDRYRIDVRTKVICGAGTRNLRKGFDLFVSTAISLLNIESNFYFIWVGDIADKSLNHWLKIQIELLHYENRFTFIPFFKDYRKYLNVLNAADVFWLTSREDPFPSVMYDAILLEKPILAFKGTGGVDDLLCNKKELLINNFDIPQLIQNTISLINNEKKCKDVCLQLRDDVLIEHSFSNYVEYLRKI